MGCDLYLHYRDLPYQCTRSGCWYWLRYKLRVKPFPRILSKVHRKNYKFKTKIVHSILTFSAAARVAALLAPFIGQVRQLGNFVPYLIIAVLAFLCLSVFWMLPETRGRNLPQVRACSF